MTPRVRLIIAAALFVGWLSWLGFTALTKSRAPVVSHAQAAGATVAVVAELTVGEDGAPAAVATTIESLTPDAPGAGPLVVVNLPKSRGFTGPGRYLLLLNKGTPESGPVYLLAGQQRSPGADIGDVGPPVIYPWSDKTADDLRKQVKKLFP